MDDAFQREASEAGSGHLSAEKDSNSEDSEEEEIPEDLADLTPAQQQARIKLRASIFYSISSFDQRFRITIYVNFAFEN